MRPPSDVAPDSARTPDSPGPAEPKQFRLQQLTYGGRIVHFGNINVFRSQRCLAICPRRREPTDVTIEILSIASRRRAHHTCQDPHRAATIKSGFRERAFAAKNQRGRAVRNGRAHRQRQWECDRWRSKDFVYRHRLPVLSTRIVHRMSVILGGNRGDLPLRHAKPPHQLPPKRGVHIHEAAVRFRTMSSRAAAPRPDPLPPGGQCCFRPFRYPTRSRISKTSLPCRSNTFSPSPPRAQCRPRPHESDSRQDGKPCSRSRTHSPRCESDAFDTERQQRNLSANERLPFHESLYGIAEKSHLDTAAITSRIAQRFLNRHRSQLFDAFVHAAERRHPDPTM